MKKKSLSNLPLNQHPLFFKRFQVCVCNLIIPKNPMTLGLYYYFPYPSLNRIEVVVVSSLLHYTHIYIHLSSLVMYLKRGANQRLSSLLRLLLRLLPQNFYMAPYLERGQEESSPIGINGHSTLERKATKPFSKSTFWPYVCVCAWKHLPVMLGQIGELVKVVSETLRRPFWWRWRPLEENCHTAMPAVDSDTWS